MFHGKNWRAKIFLRTRTKTPPEKEGDFKGEGEKCFGETGTCVVGGCAVLVTRLDGSAAAGARNGWIVTRVVRRGAILLTSLPPSLPPHFLLPSAQSLPLKGTPLPPPRTAAGKRCLFSHHKFPKCRGTFRSASKDLRK